MTRRTDLSEKKRLHVYWSGRVQGVGFRYTAESVALELSLTGWVRNLPDGRVEAVCEGSETSLKTLLDKIRAGPMDRYIQQVQATWDRASGEFDDFEIRFYSL